MLSSFAQQNQSPVNRAKKKKKRWLYLLQSGETMTLSVNQWAKGLAEYLMMAITIGFLPLIVDHHDFYSCQEVWLNVHVVTDHKQPEIYSTNWYATTNSSLTVI